MKRFFNTGLLAGMALALASAAGGAQAAYGYQGGYNDSRSGYDNYRGVVRCESRDGRTKYCRIDARGSVRLVNQTSQAACIRGRSWGVSGNSVWVSRGCRGRFASTGYGDSRYGYGDDQYQDGRYDGRYDERYDDSYDNRYDNRYDNQYGYGSGRVLRCESREGRYNFCSTYGNVGRAQLRRQLSDASCRLNVSWGYRNGGIWVDRGCRAEFTVY